MRRARLLRALAPLVLVAAAAGQSIDFEALAQRFAQRHVPADGDALTGDLATLVRRAFAGGLLGAVDLRFPPDVARDREGAALLQRASLAVLDTQRAWLEWLAPQGEAREQALADLETVRKALKSARAGSMASAAREHLDLLDLIGASDQERLAAERLGGAFASGAALGFEPRNPRPAALVLAPRRADFLELAAYAGARAESLREVFWQPVVADWTEFWIDDVQVVALEYAAERRKPEDLERGEPMDRREKTGLEQHLAQRTAISLAWQAFDRGFDPALELGVAQELVIALYGENNTRSGGSGRGNETVAYEMFVPGGLSQGGILPAMSADSRWRSTLGKDHFLKPLRDAHRAGMKDGGRGRERGWFQLATPGGGEKHNVRAPFLGAAARGREQPPAAFMSDYLEFFRAYKSAFVHWLRSAAAGDEEESAAAFRELAQRVAAGKGFEAALEEVYGAPLSAPDPKADALEGRFLEWLGK